MGLKNGISGRRLQCFVKSCFAVKLKYSTNCNLLEAFCHLQNAVKVEDNSQDSLIHCNCPNNNDSLTCWLTDKQLLNPAQGNNMTRPLTDPTQ